MGKKILVVEDNVKNRILLRDVLVFHGYEVLEAENGKEGVSIAEERLPDLIFLDIQMPVMDGLTAIQRLRSIQRTSAIKTVALTSFAMKGDQEKLLEAGFDAYLSKPLDPDYIPELVKMLIG